MKVLRALSIALLLSGFSSQAKMDMDSLKSCCILAAVSAGCNFIGTQVVRDEGKVSRSIDHVENPKKILDSIAFGAQIATIDKAVDCLLQDEKVELDMKEMGWDLALSTIATWVEERKEIRNITDKLNFLFGNNEDVSPFIRKAIMLKVAKKYIPNFTK